jgi:hypothetical protein
MKTLGQLLAAVTAADNAASTVRAQLNELERALKDAAIGLKPRPEKVAVAEKHLWKIP